MISFIKRESIISKVSFLLVLCIVIGLLTSCSSTPAGSSSGAAFSKKITPVSEFSNGLAVVERDGEYGYIDTTGRVVIPIQFSEAASFKDGVALVYTSSKEGEGFKAYIDATGEIIFDYREYEAIYDEVFLQHEGFIGVVKKTPDLYPVTEQYGFIDLHGNIIMPLQGEWKVDAKTRYSDGVVWLKNTKVKTQSFNYNATEMITQTHTFYAFNQEAKPIFHISPQKITDTFLNGVKQNQQFECNFMMGCAVVSLSGTLDYSSADSRFARGLPLEHVTAYEVWNPTKGKVFYRKISKYLSPPLNITFPTELGDGYILVCTDTEMKDKNGQFLSQYNFLDVNTGWMSDNIDLGGSGNRLKSKEISGFSEGLIALNVWGEDGKDYSYYVDKEGKPVTQPQTEYVLGDFNGGYAVWKKLDDKGQAHAYIVNRDFQILSQPIPIDDDSNFLRFQNGYCLQKHNGVKKFIDTQGKELVIQDYEDGQAPVVLTDEMRIPDLSAPRQTPPPATIAPQSPLPASPSAEPTKPPQASPSPNSYPITDNTPIDEIVDIVAGGMYFVNRDNGYVAYIVDVWDGCGSVFVNGKELLQFEVYDYKHEKGDISTGPFIKFYGTNPEPEDLPIVTFDYTRGWIRITGEYEGERFNGIYDYAPTEPPIPSDRVWGDYSSALLEEMAELDRMAAEAGDDDY